MENVKVMLRKSTSSWFLWNFGIYLPDYICRVATWKPQLSRVACTYKVLTEVKFLKALSSITEIWFLFSNLQHTNETLHWLPRHSHLKPKIWSTYNSRQQILLSSGQHFRFVFGRSRFQSRSTDNLTSFCCFTQTLPANTGINLPCDHSFPPNSLINATGP